MPPLEIVVEEYTGTVGRMKISSLLTRGNPCVPVEMIVWNSDNWGECLFLLVCGLADKFSA